MFTTLAAAPEIAISYTPKAEEHATIAGVEVVKYRSTRVLEYRGLTQATSDAAADSAESDLAGSILVNGAGQTGNSIDVDGFDAATGYVFPGASVVLAGDDHTYHVKSLATIAANATTLVLDEQFIDADITSNVDGGSQTGTTIALDWGTVQNWTVRKGTILTFAVITGTYTVVTAVKLTGATATLTITPALASSPADDEAVTMTHPSTNTAVTLETSGIIPESLRANDAGMYTLRITANYYDDNWR